MRILKFCALVLTFAMAVPLWAQSMSGDKAPDIAGVLNNRLSQVEKEVTEAAEAMPEDKFSFAPSNGEFKGVRTFGEQVRHIANSNYLFGAGILQEKSPVDTSKENGPDTYKTKAEIMQYLKDSFAYAHKAMSAVNAANLVAEIPSPFNPKAKTTPLALAMVIYGHPFDHYGQMVVYLRMNGIIPPASRPRK